MAGMRGLDAIYKKVLDGLCKVVDEVKLVPGTPEHASVQTEAVDNLGKATQEAFPEGGLQADDAAALISMLSSCPPLSMSNRSTIIANIWRQTALTNSGTRKADSKQSLGQ